MKARRADHALRRPPGVGPTQHRHPLAALATLGSHREPRTAVWSEEDARRVLSIACRAPSICNTQPWTWRFRPDGVELYADRTRLLGVSDPDGRDLLMSCGSALHHLQVALRAHGWEPIVIRLPDPSRPDLVARVEITPHPSGSAALDELAALRARCTDRRRFTAWPVADDKVAALVDSAQRWGVTAVTLTDVGERFRAELLVGRALRLRARDPAALREHRDWVDRPDGSGVPRDVIPSSRAADDSYASRFGVGTLEDPGREVIDADTLIVLGAARDTPDAWVRCGEALSALWLRAVQEGLSVLPLSQLVEVPETRAALRHDVLAGLLEPLLLVRVGWQAIGRSQLVSTPRRRLDEMLVTS